jgi:tetratricopeptide (TPR) repeat protein
VRVVVEQKGVDVALALAAPDGKPLLEANLTKAGGRESRSAEAATSGEHRLTISAIGSATLTGSYQVEVEVKAASAQDKQRLVAEGLLADAVKSNQQGAAAETALQKATEALRLWREMGDRYWEAVTVHLIGQAYLSAAKYEKAVEAYNQALSIWQELKDRRNEAQVFADMASVSYELTRGEKTIEYSERALTIHRELKDRQGEARALNFLGNGYWHLRDYEKCIAYHNQALAIYRELKNHQSEAQVLINLGNIYQSLCRFEKGREYYEQALAIRRDMRSLADEAKILYSLAQTERARGNLPASRTHIEESLRIVESLRADKESIGTSPASRASFLASVQESYRFYTDLLMRQHREEPTKGFDTLAIETSERQRARSLLDQLIEARADLRQGVDAALIERERTLSKQLNDKAQHVSQATKPEEAGALKKEINRLETEYERAQAAIRKASPHYALTQPQPLKLTEIQAQLDADTLLLEYALGEERSYLWAITKDSLKGYELPKEAEIRERALQYVPFAMLPEPRVSKAGSGGQGSGVGEKTSAPDPRPPATDCRSRNYQPAVGFSTRHSTQRACR